MEKGSGTKILKKWTNWEKTWTLKSVDSRKGTSGEISSPLLTGWLEKDPWDSWNMNYVSIGSLWFVNIFTIEGMVWRTTHLHPQLRPVRTVDCFFHEFSTNAFVTYFSIFFKVLLVPSSLFVRSTYSSTPIMRTHNLYKILEYKIVLSTG